MRRLLWHTMMSLDGFVAGPRDAMQSVFDVDNGGGATADEVVLSIGVLIVGRRTQDVEDRDQPGFYGGAYSGPFFVLRHNPPPEPPVVKGVTGRFLDVDIEEALTIAHEAAGDGDVVILGADIACQYLERPGCSTRSSCTSRRCSWAAASASRTVRRHTGAARAHFLHSRGRNDGHELPTTEMMSAGVRAGRRSGNPRESGCDGYRGGRDGTDGYRRRHVDAGRRS